MAFSALDSNLTHVILTFSPRKKSKSVALQMNSTLAVLCCGAKFVVQFNLNENSR